MLAVDYDRLGVQQWLARLGARPVEDAYGVQGFFADIDAQSSPQSNAQVGQAPALGEELTGQIFPLSDLGLIQVNGTDAVKFLHSQLTNDVEKLHDSQWRWYGYCNAKGRMQLSAAGFKSAEAIALIVSRPLAAPMAKRLGMFVMRAKAKVSDESAQHEIYGVQGDIAPLLSLLDPTLRIPAPGTSLRTALADEPIEILALEPFNLLEGSGDSMQAREQARAVPRYLVVTNSGSAFWTLALSSGLQAANSTWWRLSEVATASARIVPATYELFVPQMLNFESLGGVDFKKGCYPGQEVVARSQYLGKLKRRMFLGTLSQSAASQPVSKTDACAQAFEPRPAQDVWQAQAAEGQEPCGQVVLAAALPGQAVHVLFEAQTGAVEKGGIGLRDSAGHWYALSVRALPYPLLEI